MAAAEKIMGNIGSAGYPTSVQTAAQSLLGDVAGRVMSSSAQQQYGQAQADWVRAKLRKESGAVIGPQEMQDEISTYFPKLGDGPDVIRQKTEARLIAQEAMRRNAGPALNTMPEESKGPRKGAGSGTHDDPFKIKGDDGYSTIKSGEFFTGPDGQLRRKP